MTSMPDGLMNSERMRALIKRHFSGKFSELLLELLQNAQRANAQHVAISMTPTMVTFEDDGSGITDFRALVVLAESAYQPEVIEQQNPMGVGFHALLAYEGVTEVIVTSGDRAMTIDTSRWWTDPAYYYAWPDLIQPIAEPVQGTRITLKGTNFPVFAANDMRTWNLIQQIKWFTPFFQITFQDDVLPTTSLYDDFAKGPGCLYTGVIEGNRFIAQFTRDQKNSLIVDWYGQRIVTPWQDAQAHGWSLFLEVRHGQPVHPKAPTRDGIILDSAFTNTCQTMLTQVYEHLMTLTPPKDPRHVFATWSFKKTTIDRYPWVIAVPITDTSTDTIVDSRTVPQFLTDTTLYVHKKSFDVGFTQIDFGPDLSYILKEGRVPSDRLCHVRWYPGANTEQCFGVQLVEPGEIVVLSGPKPHPESRTIRRFPLTTPLIAAENKFCTTDYLYEPDNTVFHFKPDILSTVDPATTFEKLEDFVYDCSCSEEYCLDSFQIEISHLLRQLMPDTIDGNSSLFSVVHDLHDAEHTVQSIRIDYGPYHRITGFLVTYTDGTTKPYRLLPGT